MNRHRTRLVGIVSASGISILGSRMSFVAIPWLVLVTSGSPARMGLVSGAEMLPYVLASSMGAPLLDRLGSRRTAILADLASAVAMAGVATAYRSGFGVLLTLVAVAGGLRGFGDNAKKVLVPPRASAAEVALPRVIAAFDAMNKFSMMIGAAVAGVLIAWLGAPSAILVDAGSFVAAAVLVVVSTTRPMATADAGTAAPPTKEPYLTAMRGGLAHVWADRITFTIFVMLFGINVFNQAAGVVFVPLWADRVTGSAAAIGVTLGALSLGAVLGSVAFTMLAGRIPRYAVFTVGFLVGGPPRFFALGLGHSIVVVTVVSFVSGLALAAINPTISTLVIERTPPELHARVFGLNTAVAWAGIPLGGFFGGWAVAGLGLTGALVLSGVLYLGIALIPVVGYRSWQAIDRPRTAAAPTTVEATS
jgi:predicted MFS family arabinose efflux permease